jgi:hypothetical protein
VHRPVPGDALTGAQSAQDGTNIPLMKANLKLARLGATWSFQGHGVLSNVDTTSTSKQNNSRLNGTQRPLSRRTALRLQPHMKKRRSDTCRRWWCPSHHCQWQWAIACVPRRYYKYY